MSLGKFEKEEQELYFEQYKIQSGISKNYGQNFYDLFHFNSHLYNFQLFLYQNVGPSYFL